MNHTRSVVVLVTVVGILGASLRASAGGPMSEATGPGPAVALEEALRLAREHNHSIKLARERLNQAEASIKQAWTSVQPSLSAYATYTYNQPEAAFDTSQFIGGYIPLYDYSIADAQLELGRTDLTAEQRAATQQQLAILQGARTGLGAALDTEPIEIIKKHQWRAGLSLTQPVFNGMAIPAIGIANDAFEAATQSATMTEELIVAAVEEVYVRTLTLQEIVGLMQRLLASAEEHLDVARKKLAVGRVTQLAVLRCEVDAERARYNLAKAVAGVDTMKNALGVLIGLDGPFSLARPNEPTAVPSDEATLYKAALDQRRDLQLARLSEGINDQLVTMAWMQFLPMLNLTAGWNWSNSAGFSGEKTSWNVGLSLYVPIYDRGARYASLDSARSKLAEAGITVEKLRYDIRTQVRTALLEVDIGKRAVAAAEKQVEIARATAKLAEDSFAAGVATPVDVSDASNMLAAAELQAATERLNLHLAELKLRNVLVIPVALGSSGGSASGGQGGGDMSGGASGGSGGSGEADSGMSSGSSAGGGGMGGGGMGGPPM